MKISIITVVYNNVKTIRTTIESVLSQTYHNIEYIIIDGKSTDGSLEIIQSYKDQITKYISEIDHGIYDAMNKGIKLATGDIIGILNSDDFYVNNQIIEKIVKIFNEQSVDSIFADLVYVKPDNLNQIVRYYNSNNFNLKKFAYGWMPAHPTFFVKRWAYEKYGLFKTNYKIAADFELLVRFLYKNQLTYYHLKEPIIKMRVGGVSTKNFKSHIIANYEIIQACKENNIYTNWLMLLTKIPKKLLECCKKNS